MKTRLCSKLKVRGRYFLVKGRKEGHQVATSTASRVYFYLFIFLSRRGLHRGMTLVLYCIVLYHRCDHFILIHPGHPTRAKSRNQLRMTADNQNRVPGRSPIQPRLQPS